MGGGAQEQGLDSASVCLGGCGFGGVHPRDPLALLGLVKDCPDRAGQDVDEVDRRDVGRLQVAAPQGALDQRE